jgi:hypothetical protein
MAVSLPDAGECAGAGRREERIERREEKGEKKEKHHHATSMQTL